MLNVENFMQRHDQITPIGFHIFGFEVPTLSEPESQCTFTSIFWNAGWGFVHIFYWLYRLVRYIIEMCCVKCVWCAPFAMCVNYCCSEKTSQNDNATVYGP